MYRICWPLIISILLWRETISNEITLPTIDGTIISRFCNTSVKNVDNRSPAEICKNPLVTSARQTPFGVICMIPKSVDSGSADFSKRQLFVRSLPKLLKAEAKESANNKLVPGFKSIRDHFLPQSNILSKRSIFSNWVFKFYESFYKGFYNSLKTSALLHNQNKPQPQSPQPLVAPQQSQRIPVVMPVANPDQLTPDGQAVAPVIAKLNEFQPFSHSDPNFMSNFAQNKENFFGQEFHGPQHDLEHHHHPPIFNDDNDEVMDNIPEIDETRLGSAQPDLPHYSYGSVRQLATYLQSIQEKINRQKEKNMKEEQTDSSEYVNDYSPYSPETSEDNQEFVIPWYTDVKVRENNGHSLSRSSEDMRRPRKLVYEFHGYKRDMDCKGRFKPLKADTEREQPMPPKVQLMTERGKRRRKRYIEFDYGQMQLRKLPIWFDKMPLSEAIVEVKPRSLFRWEQPMIGWKPIVPPELLRKDLFLKRNGDPMNNKWDNEQVESERNYYWLKTDGNQTLVTSADDDLKSAESQTLETIENLDSVKASVVVDRRKYGRDMYGDSDYKKSKEQQIYDKHLRQEKAGEDVLTIGGGVKAIEVENVGDEISKVKSLEEIAALPGAVIKPIDAKLTDILLKVLSHNSDFQQKRITNAYFLDFPKLPVYKPEVTQLNPISNFKASFLYPEQRYTPIPTLPVTESPLQIPIESTLDKNYELAYDRDIELTEADYQYGEVVCANKVSGGVADVRNDCRIYFQCTQYTIDTYVCPRGSRFDDTKQFCLPSSQVLCGKYL